MWKPLTGRGAVVPANGLVSRPLLEPGDSRALLAAQATALLVLAITVATRYWHDHPWLGVLLLAVTCGLAVPEFTRQRARRWWFVYVAGIFAYTLLRALADETAIPVRTGYVIDFDRWLGLGTDPVTRLQDRFFSVNDVSALDVAAVATHWSFFIAPHLAAVLIFVYRRPLFPQYAALLVATMYAGLLLFFLVPTSPPWLAGEQGALPGVVRIMDFVGGKVDGTTYQDLQASLGEPNSVAAMPSIHMAITFAMFLWARVYVPRAAWPLLGYTLVMGVALVYLGEHYVLDLLVGAGCALVCFLLTRRFVHAPPA